MHLPRAATAISERAVRPAVLLLTGLWCVALFVQWGHPYDETEHAHVAWLMGKLGQQPLQDFFQHHMPLLWDVLKVYFLVGLDGPEVLFFGRGLVVASMLTLVLGWLALGRRLAKDDVGAACGAAVGVCSIVAFFLMAPEIIVVRPESLAVGPWMLACLCWRAASSAGPVARQPGLYFLSGMFFCAAACFSPRIALLTGWFFFLGGRTASRTDAGAWVVGALVFLGLYLALSGTTLRYLFFATSYSALLQRVGEWDPVPYFAAMPCGKLLFVQAGLWMCVYRALTPQWRRTAWLHLGYFVFVVALGAASCWPHVYLQNFVPAYLSLAGSLVVLGSHAHWRLAARGVLLLLLGSMIVVMAMKLWNDTTSRATLFEDIERRRTILCRITTSDTVLLSYPSHPISARDASYYGPWLVDSPNRMGEAVSLVRDRYGLPACDYVEALNLMSPRLIDSDLRLAVPTSQLPEMRAAICARYDLIRWTRGYFPVLIFERRDASPGVDPPE